jgi:transcription antitermination protein NusB
MISQRHLARIVAMQTLYLVRIKKDNNYIEPLNYLIQQLPEPLKNSAFPELLVKGTLENLQEIEQNIMKYSTEQSLEKIDILTLSILTLGVYEILFAEKKQPMPVVINEAIELAKSFAKDSAPSLVNAILSQVSQIESS